MGKQRKTKNIDLTVGNIPSSLWKFAVPLMLGNVLQQLYNLVDTWVVGHYIGDNALAAVGSSYTLMTFLTSIVIGLCLGSSAFLSMAYGKKSDKDIKKIFPHRRCRFLRHLKQTDHRIHPDINDPGQDHRQ